VESGLGRVQGPGPAELGWESAAQVSVRLVWEPDPSVRVPVVEPAPGPSFPCREEKEEPRKG
jgi:hypothetical protein